MLSWLKFREIQPRYKWGTTAIIGNDINQPVSWVHVRLHTHTRCTHTHILIVWVGIKGLITASECHISVNVLVGVQSTRKKEVLTLNHTWDCVPQPGLGVAFTWYLAGCSTTPNLPSRLGRECPGGTVRVKRCRIQDRKRKSSILARASPRQTLTPAPNGR